MPVLCVWLKPVKGLGPTQQIWWHYRSGQHNVQRELRFLEGLRLVLHKCTIYLLQFSQVFHISTCQSKKYELLFSSKPPNPTTNEISFKVSLFSVINNTRSCSKIFDLSLMKIQQHWGLIKSVHIIATKQQHMRFECQCVLFSMYIIYY